MDFFPSGVTDSSIYRKQIGSFDFKPCPIFDNFVSSTFVQPFLAYITDTKTTLGLNTESTYNWETNQWSVPVNGTVAQLLKIGPQIIQILVGVRYWAEAPDNGPEEWGGRAQLTFLFPK